MLTALVVLVLVAVVTVQEMRADRLKSQIKSLNAVRSLHDRVLNYAVENAREGVYIVRIDTVRALVWVAYTTPAGELAAPAALQKILAGTWVRMTGLSTAGQAVYQWRPPRPEDEQG